MKELVSKIFEKIKRDPYELEAYDDLFNVCRNCEKDDFTYYHKVNAKLRAEIATNISKSGKIRDFFELYKKTLLFDAKSDLDSYLLYVEIKREPEKRFYQPRRAVLKPVVDALQELAEDKLDELFLSMPPRVGKSSLMIFFMTWLIGRDSEKSNLYCSFTDIITKAFYEGVLEIIQDTDTYAWRDVFPDSKVVRTNAANELLDIERRKHYPSLTCRSIDGTLNGACDASGVIIGDDLVSGIEEALSKDRLISKWGKVDNNLIPRGKARTKYLWIGTRWSVIDPAGIRLDTLQNDDKYKGYRYKVINLPALNDKDESNFDYPYGVGFDTLYYQRRRASFERNNDIASWNAQFMGEPIEREGTVFTPADFRYYNGELPDGEPDRVFMAVDPAYGGGDFVAAPVCYQYGNDIYVHEVVYDKGDKKVTIPQVISAIEKNNIAAVQIEGTKATSSYKDEVEAGLKEKNIRINLTSKAAPTNTSKLQRIFDKAPDIREFMIFREEGKRTVPYQQFMQNVFAFKLLGKNKNDDAPDSLAMAIDMLRRPDRSVTVFKRPF